MSTLSIGALVHDFFVDYLPQQKGLRCQRASNFDQRPASKIDQGFPVLFLI